ncbi:hypothetical protein ACFE33_15835 (plasmid) [Falsihalocynthiibacter sp. SS001]|uniref:hypothetical protein n=1 Tax=Falsihalocynthiibacter sp. SS001 TaxID=3349698 RepID=UPI0036D3460B
MKNIISNEIIPAKFTILEAAQGLIQTKRFHKGGVDNTSRAKNFKHEVRTATCFDDPMTITNHHLETICDRLKGTLRKCLGWRTPTEAFRKKFKLR